MPTQQRTWEHSRRSGGTGHPEQRKRATNLAEGTKKVAVVTGGNGGLGLGFARGIARQGGDVEIWSACGFTGNPYPSPPLRNVRCVPGALGRLKPGITLEQAQRRLDALAIALQRAYPDDYPKQQGWSLRLERAQTSLTGNVRPTLVILLAAVSFVLLIV